jgi:hypothetical protein
MRAVALCGDTCHLLNPSHYSDNRERRTTLQAPIITASPARDLIVRFPAERREHEGRVDAAIGFILNVTPIDPIKPLFGSAVINGVVAVSVMVMMMLLAARHRKVHDWSATWGCLAASVIAPCRDRDVRNEGIRLNAVRIIRHCCEDVSWLRAQTDRALQLSR